MTLTEILAWGGVFALGWALALLTLRIGRSIGYRLGTGDARVTQLHCACGWTSPAGTASEVLGHTMDHIGESHD